MNTTQDPIKLQVRGVLDKIQHGYYDLNDFDAMLADLKSAEDFAVLQSAAAQPPGFDAHDMATAAADGFRDGLQAAQASEPSAEARTENDWHFERAAFEEWCGVMEDPNIKQKLDRDEIGYTSSVIAACWEAWCGRASIAYQQIQDSINSAPARAVEPLTHWVVLAPCGEGVVFADGADAEWTATGKGGGFGKPAIGEAFRECYGHQTLTLHRIGITTTPAAKAGKDGAHE